MNLQLLMNVNFNIYITDMKLNKQLIISLLMLTGAVAQSQEVLTLEECRHRALEANRGLKQAEMKRVETHNMERAALMEMLPKVSAAGEYTWTMKSVHLLSDEQEERINNMGNAVQEAVDQAIRDEASQLPVGGEFIGNYLASVINNSGLAEELNNVGHEITDGLNTDTRNMSVVTLTLTQPVYLGGKLLAMHRTAMLMDHLAGIEYSQKEAATLQAVDEAYWQVVSVEHKKRLAERYAALLDTLEANVQAAVDAEVATRGDLAKVRVKRNEAQMALTKATNGLVLAKMLLAERCGMPLDQDFVLSEEGGMRNDELKDSPLNIPRSSMDEVYARRSELKMLRIADSAAREGVRTAASVLKPNVVVTGGYMMSNPNVFNGFKNEWGGTPMVAVAVGIPIVHPAGIYALKAAKAKRKEVEYQRQEAEELIALQVSKLRYEHELSYKKLSQAESNLEMANENLRLADESYKAGVCSSSDLMMAQTAWLQAEGEVLDARIEIEMTRLYLKQALGIK